MTTIALLLAALAAAQPAALPPTPPIPKGGDIPRDFAPVRAGFGYEKRDVMIPMRDGVKLHTVIVVPTGATRAPMMLDRTPYSASKLVAEGDGGPLVGQILFPAYAELAQHGYIIVAQDVRGKYGSGGDYVMNRPLKGPLNATAVDHATDTWDTIEWLVHHVPEANGRVGTIGTSYDGFTTLMSLVHPHPALKAAVPMNPMVDVWRGDDWFHNGAFRQEMMGYIYSQTATKASDDDWVSFTRDDYDGFLRAGSAGAFGRAAGMDALPFWRRLVEHPAYDSYWQEQAVDKLLARAPLTVPTLLVDGQWDQEDIYGAPAVYQALKGQAGDRLHLVLGPWYHGQENGPGEKLGPFDWGSDTGRWFREHIMLPFLDANLKNGAPAADLPRVYAFETGSNQWQRLADWPAPGAVATPLFLQADGGLTLGAPGAGETGYDEYVSDPAKPVTYRPRPNTTLYAKGSTWHDWLVDDQRFAAGRPDVLVYETAPLTQAVHIAGQPVAHLAASTSGTDGDWIVKLIDVYPDLVPEQPALGGYQLGIAMDILRGRYRDDPARPVATPAGAVVDYRLALPGADHVFLPGHRIMVQVQSSWFPLYDRNPQSFVPNIFDAKPADYQKATVRVFHDPAHQSLVELPVVR